MAGLQPHTSHATTIHENVLLLFPVRELGEQLVGAFGLTQFQSDIQEEAQDAPTIIEREPAQRVLEQLHR